MQVAQAPEVQEYGASPPASMMAKRMCLPAGTVVSIFLPSSVAVSFAPATPSTCVFGALSGLEKY
jgi:hypothetical protein